MHRGHISINGLPRVCPKTDGHDRLLMAGFGLTFFAEPSIELSSAFHFAVLPLFAPLASQVASPLTHDGA